MLRQISPELLMQYKEKFKYGTRVRLVCMEDPYSSLKPGDTGTVTGVDDIGTIHVSWDCGSSLGVAYGEDSCEIIQDKLTEVMRKLSGKSTELTGLYRALE